MPLTRRQLLLLAAAASAGGVALWRYSQRRVLAHRAFRDTSELAEPRGEPLLRLAALADTGTGGSDQYAVARALTQYRRQAPFPVALLAGDNIYNNGDIDRVEETFERPYRPLRQQGVAFRACLGNHDIRTANGVPQLHYPGFNMQGRYYTFRQGPVQVWALDTNRNANWTAQLDWLERELQRSSAPWRVVFGHHPIYSSGHYGVNPELETRLAPLFRRYGVQLYLNGHDHNYERTYPIGGTTYLTCGAGADVRSVGRSRWTAHAAERLSFAALEFHSDRALVRGIGTDGHAFDRGVVPRDATIAR